MCLSKENISLNVMITGLRGVTSFATVADVHALTMTVTTTSQSVTFLSDPNSNPSDNIVTISTSENTTLACQIEVPATIATPNAFTVSTCVLFGVFDGSMAVSMLSLS